MTKCFFLNLYNLWMDNTHNNASGLKCHEKQFLVKYINSSFLVIFSFGNCLWHVLIDKLINYYFTCGLACVD
jgi:hypothetical protein